MSSYVTSDYYTASEFVRPYSSDDIKKKYFLFQSWDEL